MQCVLENWSRATLAWSSPGDLCFQLTSVFPELTGFFWIPSSAFLLPSCWTQSPVYSSVIKLFSLLLSSDQGWCVLFVRNPTVLQGTGDIPSYVGGDESIVIVLLLEFLLIFYYYIWSLHSFVFTSSHCSKFFQFNYTLFQRFLSVKFKAGCLLSILLVFFNTQDEWFSFLRTLFYISVFLFHIRQDDTKLNQKWLSCNVGNSKLSHVGWY